MDKYTLNNSSDASTLHFGILQPFSWYICTHDVRSPFLRQQTTAIYFRLTCPDSRAQSPKVAFLSLGLKKEFNIVYARALTSSIVHDATIIVREAEILVLKSSMVRELTPPTEGNIVVHDHDEHVSIPAFLGMEKSKGYSRRFVETYPSACPISWQMTST